ncbi:hypothetical protein RY27_28695, partial [Litorilinea aerophila]
ASTSVDVPVTVDVLANDSDGDGDALTIVAVGQGANGAVTNHGVNLSYAPVSAFTGTDVFTYTVGDGRGGFATAQVTVTVNEQADAGFALEFDGSNDYVVLAETSAIMAPGWQDTKSVSLWVRPMGPGPECRIGTPAWCDAVFGDRARWWGISIGVMNGYDRLWIWNYDGSSGSMLDVIGVPYTPDEWVHIGLVHSDGVLRAYKNGVEVGSIASGTTQQPNTGAQPVLHLGGIINNASRNWTFHGQVDELRLWNTARTAAEIAQEMNAPLAGTEPGLAAYYRMSDGAGTLLTDDSGHGWTGTLNDGNQFVPADGPIQWVPSTVWAGSVQGAGLSAQADRGGVILLGIGQRPADGRLIEPTEIRQDHHQIFLPVVRAR